MPPLHRHARRAFTIVELLALAVSGVVGGSAFVAMTQPPAGDPTPPAKPATAQPGDKQPTGTPAAIARARASARQLKDSTQLRGIIQSMVIFANSNQDSFPLPSKLDAKDTTVAAKGREKDTTANIFSILIYNGSIATELCISPAEANAAISKDTDYQYTDPKAAAKPAQALWDPAFSADFTAKTGGNLSYAHLQPSDQRLSRWSSTFMSSDAIASNRGPQIKSVTADDKGTLTVTPSDPNTITYLIHGPRDSWEGNVAYADGHVSFVEGFLPKTDDDKKMWATYKDAKGVPKTDVYFYDEPEDASVSNLFLGIFTKAGDKAKDFNAIWD